MLAQRYNVMKMMLLGAILASTTNLIFVGLVKSGATMQNVQVHIGITLILQALMKWEIGH